MEYEGHYWTQEAGVTLRLLLHLKYKFIVIVEAPEEPLKNESLKKDSLNILHVTHSWGGGISAYVDDLTINASEDHNNFLLKSFGDRLEIERAGGNRAHNGVYYLSKRMQLTDFHDREYAKILSLILISFNIHVVHVSSTIHHTFDIFRIPRQLNIAVIFTVHDFFHICPTIHLVGKDGNFCGLCRHGEERINCLQAHPYVYSKFDAKHLKLWRDEFLKIKNHIDLFVFPSRSAERIFGAFYGLDASVCRVIPHGLSTYEYGPEKNHSPTGDLKVAIVGSMLRHKGKSLIKDVLKASDDDIRFFHFGDGRVNSSKALYRYGRYERKDIVRLLRSHQIDVVMLLSIWPETFSYTLSEAVAARKPVIVTNFGALKERVQENNLGWVLKDNKPDSICALLSDLKQDKNKIKIKSQHIASLHLKNLMEMKAEYRETYRTVVTENQPNYSINKYYQLYRYKLDKTFGRRRINAVALYGFFKHVTWKLARSVSYLIY